MNENFLTGSFDFNESETFGFIKKLNNSSLHCI